MTNEVTTLLNTRETYESLQPFSTLKQLNDNTEAIRLQFGEEMTDATYKVLDMLHRYSCKYYGVCYLAKGKIADMLGINRRTVIRACAALEKMGVIVQYETKRKRGDKRRSTNAIVFVPIIDIDKDDSHNDCHNKSHNGCHSVDTPTDTPINTPKVISNTGVTSKPEIINNKKVVNQKPKETKEILNTDRLPDEWFNIASPYAIDANDLYKINGSLFKAKHGLTIRIEDHADKFGEVLRSSWFKLKNGRINPAKWYAYLYTAFKRTATQIENAEAHALWYAELAEMYEPYPTT